MTKEDSPDLSVPFERHASFFCVLFPVVTLCKKVVTAAGVPTRFQQDGATHQDYWIEEAGNSYSLHARPSARVRNTLITFQDHARNDVTLVFTDGNDGIIVLMTGRQGNTYLRFHTAF